MAKCLCSNNYQWRLLLVNTGRITYLKRRAKIFTFSLPKQKGEIIVIRKTGKKAIFFVAFARSTAFKKGLKYVKV